MDETIAKINAGAKHGVARGAGADTYLTVQDEDFTSSLKTASESGFNLINLFCAQDFNGKSGFTLFYAFEKADEPNILVLERQLSGNTTTSIEEIYPSACWYEREIQDGFGVTFQSAFDTRRLFLHEAYPQDFHPLKKSFGNGRIQTRAKVNAQDEYQFKHVSGEGVYMVPVGPVHAGIIEPGHFRFSVIGETIFNLEVRMFYKHRGIEKLAEGRTPNECVRLSEAISGDETVANAVAYCSAVENICGAKAPPKAWHQRTIMLEMERIYSHLGDMAGMVIDVAYPAGASPLYILREEVLRQNDRLTGSRFMKGIMAIGGLNREIEQNRLSDLSNHLSLFAERFNEAVESIHSSPSVVDRFERTGILRKELVKPLNITGPAARASGAYIDTRKDHPYGLYDQLKIVPRTCDTGDVMARFNVKAHEVNDSVKLIQKLVSGMPDGKAYAKTEVKDGYGMSLVESPRGQSIHWVYIKNGLVDRYKIRTASFCNWQSIEHAVLGNIVPDFPLINKSLNLSYAGTDL